MELTALDAGFLHAEDSDPNISLAIGGLAVLDGPTPDQQSLISTLAQRISVCPRFAQRLRRSPFDLGAPTGSTTPLLTSPTMCGSSRCRGPATAESCSEWLRM